MVKKTTIFVLLIAAFAYCQSQITLNVSFTGATEQPRHVQLDSIQVCDLQKGWQETLIFPDTVLTLVQGNSISDALRHGDMATAFPNPCNGSTTLELTLEQPGSVQLQLLDMSGRTLANCQRSLPQGQHTFGISLPSPQTYFLAISTRQGREVLKLLNNAHGNGCAISYNQLGMSVLSKPTMQEKLTMSVAPHPFEWGDSMRYVGFANGLVSAAVFQPQMDDECVVLLFASSSLRPVVETISVSEITHSTAVVSGNVADERGSFVMERGICWDTLPVPTANGMRLLQGGGTGEFAVSISGLSANTTYYARAFATNCYGTAYGETITFTTESEDSPPR